MNILNLIAAYQMAAVHNTSDEPKMLFRQTKTLCQRSEQVLGRLGLKARRLKAPDDITLSYDSSLRS